MTEPGRVRAGVDKLRGDADLWAQAATGAQGLATAAQGLTLTGQELSFAADSAGVTAIYQELQRKLAALCQQGAGALGGIATTLRAAADHYEATEATNQANIRQAGQPPH